MGKAQSRHMRAAARQVPGQFSGTPTDDFDQSTLRSRPSRMLLPTKGDEAEERGFMARSMR